MPDYDFTPLSPPEFENLSRDLLQEHLQLHLESFANGRDRGIDLRFSSTFEGQLVVQCKHWLKSGYAKLLAHLKAEELPKIKQLSPTRYILVTSVPLTPSNKDEIAAALSPFVHCTADVVGPGDLNNWLGLYPSVERRHYKLWIVSSEVLRVVLNSGLYGRSEAQLQSMLDKAKYFVEVPEFRKAKLLLDSHGYCLILGPAGIGKTTLAEMLCLGYAGEGYEIIVVSEDVQEAFELRDSRKRQVFYYDDFLGQAAIDEKLPKNEDSRLGQFIEAVRGNERHRFILTTREYLLLQAEAAYPRLRRVQLEESMCMVTLQGLDALRRGQMLYNHVYHSSLPNDALESLLKDRGYVKIIQHQNFNPRVVERMTKYFHYVKADGQSYLDAFLESLDNPSQMWDEVLSQLSQLAKDTMLVASIMPQSTTLELLNRATDAYRATRARTLGIAASDEPRSDALRELDGSFIKTDLLCDGVTRSVAVQNPSLREHLQSMAVGDQSSTSVAVNSAQCMEQIMTLIRLDKGRSLLDPDALIGAAIRCWGISCSFFELESQKRVFFGSPSSMTMFVALEAVSGKSVAALWDAVGEKVERQALAWCVTSPQEVATFLRPELSRSDCMALERLRLTGVVRETLGPILSGEYQDDLFNCAHAVLQMCQSNADFATDSEIHAVREVLVVSATDEARDLVGACGSDTDDLFDYVDVVQAIETFFEINLGTAVGVLEEAAQESAPHASEEDDSEDDGPMIDNPWEAIHDMFDGLAEQIELLHR